MKKLITFILLLIGILSFGSLNIYAHDVTYSLDKDISKAELIIKDIDNPITLIDTETSDDKFLNDNDLTKLIIALVIYMVALFVGILIKSKLIISMSGILWLIPISIIDNFIIRIFCIIMLIISLMILLKERDDYYD